MSDAGSPLLMLVEDEAMPRELLEDALRDEGFDIAVATDGEAAIGLLDLYCGEVAGLIIDVDLGSTADGWSVAMATRPIRPDLPVFYVSGGSAHRWATMGVADSVMIPKPFAIQQFADLVKTTLRLRGSH